MVTYSMTEKPPVVPKLRYYTNEMCNIENPILGIQTVNMIWMKRGRERKWKWKREGV
jgi:hypothetical protein